VNTHDLTSHASNRASQPEHAQFFVNGHPYETDKHSLAGAEIKRIADVPLDYQLIDVSKDEVIHNHQSVHMKSGLQFEAGPHGKVS
jgi:hypothetical protein